MILGLCILRHNTSESHLWRFFFVLCVCVCVCVCVCPKTRDLYIETVTTPNVQYCVKAYALCCNITL